MVFRSVYTGKNYGLGLRLRVNGLSLWDSLDSFLEVVDLSDKERAEIIYHYPPESDKARELLLAFLEEKDDGTDWTRNVSYGEQRFRDYSLLFVMKRAMALCSPAVKVFPRNDRQLKEGYSARVLKLNEEGLTIYAMQGVPTRQNDYVTIDEGNDVVLELFCRGHVERGPFRMIRPNHQIKTHFARVLPPLLTKITDRYRGEVEIVAKEYGSLVVDVESA